MTVQQNAFVELLRFRRPPLLPQKVGGAPNCSSLILAEDERPTNRPVAQLAATQERCLLDNKHHCKLPFTTIATFIIAAAAATHGRGPRGTPGAIRGKI